jgi:hypothetical protein
MVRTVCPKDAANLQIISRPHTPQRYPIINENWIKESLLPRDEKSVEGPIADTSGVFKLPGDFLLLGWERRIA